MAIKVIRIELSTGDFAQTGNVLEETDAVVTPTPNGVPRATADGTIAAGWIPDAAKAVALREVDGDPSLGDITRLVVANGDLISLGNGEARIRTASDVVGGGPSGTTLTVREASGAPSVASVTRIEVGAGDLTDAGNGVVRIKTAADVVAGGGGGSGAPDVGGILTLWSYFS